MLLMLHNKVGWRLGFRINTGWRPRWSECFVSDGTGCQKSFSGCDVPPAAARKSFQALLISWPSCDRFMTLSGGSDAKLQSTVLIPFTHLPVSLPFALSHRRSPRHRYRCSHPRHSLSQRSRSSTTRRLCLDGCDSVFVWGAVAILPVEEWRISVYDDIEEGRRKVKHRGGSSGFVCLDA